MTAAATSPDCKGGLHGRHYWSDKCTDSDGVTYRKCLNKVGDRSCPATMVVQADPS